MKIIIAIAFVIAQATASGCGAGSTANTIQSKQQAMSDLQASREVGFPHIVHYFERRELKLIDELRDQGVPTVTYRQDMNGRYHKICDSLGFPMPYAVQFTNPEAVQFWKDDGSISGYSNYGHETLPQADPNSLYSPPEAAGTWIACVNPRTKQMEITYSEPDVVTYPADYPVPGE